MCAVYYYVVVYYLLECVVDLYSMIGQNQQHLGHHLNEYMDLIDEQPVLFYYNTMMLYIYKAQFYCWH